MTTSMLAFGKANASGSLRLSKQAAKLYSSTSASAPSNGNGSYAKSDDAAAQRDLFVNVLTSNATKRDAKQYLARFRPAKKQTDVEQSKLSEIQEERNARHRQDQDRLDRLGVNLGGLYAPARAIAESPQFAQQHVADKSQSVPQQKIHVALICLRAPETLDDTTLDGVALTLSQLVKLDMKLLILLDCGKQPQVVPNARRMMTSLKELTARFAEQSDRLARAIGRHSRAGARIASGAFEVNEDIATCNESGVTQMVAVAVPNLLLEPLKRTLIPIVPTFGYTSSGQLVRTSATSVMASVSSLLSGLPGTSNASKTPNAALETSLDRIIILDSAGGIPSKARGDDAHVFINLEQEFKDIETELAEYELEAVKGEEHPSYLTNYSQHRGNLRMVQNCLAMLPSATSALIITPQEAAASSSPVPPSKESAIGAGTRRQKNTLIHNLLTNKPVVSSSLPAARLPSSISTSSENTALHVPSATLIKRGMPITIIPSADRSLGWQAPQSGITSLALENDSRVDFSRLVHLINDSFRRKLDVHDYLNRIQGRIAGLIVAGEYEGGAILTWEMPTGVNDSGRLVPYLDKFAVLSSSQGSVGVADILFQAMVRTCFPYGVCWRSRKDNPVNKWYFERSDGTWQIPNTNWTMFWTGQGVVEDELKFNDYVSVCRDVKPSWADGKKPD